MNTFKIKIYKHSSIKTPIDDDIEKVIPYFNGDFVKNYIDIIPTIDIENTDKDYKNDTLFKPNEGIYDVVVLIYEQGTFPVYGSTYPYSNKMRVCYVSVNPLEDNIEYSWKTIVHELLHALVFKTMADKGVFIKNVLDFSSPTFYFKNDNPYAIDGNFSQQLALLKPYLKETQTSTWKYFKLTESTGSNGHTVSELNKGLVDKLDIVRGECGFPFIINSGYRTPTENSLLKDSVKDSSHILRLAVDIKCIDSTKRMKIISSAFLHGFKRIGIHSQYIHLDLDNSKSSSIWLY